MAVLTTLYSGFNIPGTSGGGPITNLVVDPAGDLFGTTPDGGSNNDGMVFEFPTGSIAPLALFVFSGSNGQSPNGPLAVDAGGNVFGTAEVGGSHNGGTAFEIPHTGGTYTGTSTTLINFNPSAGGFNPGNGLVFDGAGNLLGTTFAGGQSSNAGTVFEIAKTAGGYANTATTLASFNGSGLIPDGLMVDAAGNLVGSTTGGGTNGVGTIFEIQNLGTVANPSYANTATILASFHGTDGAYPQYTMPLVADAAGDLFGTTQQSQTSSSGTVFELQNLGAAANPSYASTPTTLYTFNALLFGSLVVDAAGDLFGVTGTNGNSNNGYVFELVKTGGSYTGKLLVSLSAASGNFSLAGLIANSAGDLFGVADAGGAHDNGSVFEVTQSGFVTPHPTTVSDFYGFGTDDILWRNAQDGHVDVWTIVNGQHTADTVMVSPPSANAQIVGTGAFYGGSADILWQDTVTGRVYAWTMANGGLAATNVLGDGTSVWQIAGIGNFDGSRSDSIIWQNTSNHAVDLWTIANGQHTADTVITSLPSANAQIVGTGDFNGDRTDDVLWQDTVTGAVDLWTMQNGAVAATTALGTEQSPWQLAGIGDFHGTGTDDILWYNTSDTSVDIWQMQNGQRIADNIIGTAPSGGNWQIAGVGDYFGNGTDDILWHNGSTGSVDLWTMQNGQHTADTVIGGGVPPSIWQIQPTEFHVLGAP